MTCTSRQAHAMSAEPVPPAVPPPPVAAARVRDCKWCRCKSDGPEVVWSRFRAGVADGDECANDRRAVKYLTRGMTKADAAKWKTKKLKEISNDDDYQTWMDGERKDYFSLVEQHGGRMPRQTEQVDAVEESGRHDYEVRGIYWSEELWFKHNTEPPSPEVGEPVVRKGVRMRRRRKAIAQGCYSALRL